MTTFGGPPPKCFFFGELNWAALYPLLVEAIPIFDEFMWRSLYSTPSIVFLHTYLSTWGPKLFLVFPDFLGIGE
jgi:hypothetical protein